MDQQIHNNVRPPLEWNSAKNLSAHSSLYHFIPHHNGTSRPPPTPSPQSPAARKSCREWAPPGRLSVSHTLHSPDSLIFFAQVRDSDFFAYRSTADADRRTNSRPLVTEQKLEVRG